MVRMKVRESWIVLIDGPHLARIRHQDAVAEILEKPADPGAVRADLHNHQRAGMSPAQRGQSGAGVGDGFAVENGSLGVEHANRVLAVAEVDSHGDGGR
jgi:hypothetical protein